MHIKSEFPLVDAKAARYCAVSPLVFRLQSWAGNNVHHASRARGQGGRMPGQGGFQHHFTRGTIPVDRAMPTRVQSTPYAPVGAGLVPALASRRRWDGPCRFTHTDRQNHHARPRAPTTPIIGSCNWVRPEPGRAGTRPAPTGRSGVLWTIGCTGNTALWIMHSAGEGEGGRPLSPATLHSTPLAWSLPSGHGGCWVISPGSDDLSPGALAATP
jgi:hypothetical protein